MCANSRHASQGESTPVRAVGGGKTVVQANRLGGPRHGRFSRRIIVRSSSGASTLGRAGDHRQAVTETLDDTLAATMGGQRGTAPALAEGERLGRYVLLEKLGVGGMGVVYAAYDPRLNRRVALKLLIPSAFADARTTEGRTRLLREAQAMAQLQHPNVVGVHDVGEHGDSVFIAMEFVEGTTLRDWLTDTPRSLREILATFAAAGAGLAAAHRKGFVHRDFKPDNVMVGTDGRVRVMDFGLARGELAAEAECSMESTEAAAVFEPELTRAGSVLGTPRYMAPEQHMAQPADARSDQFSFCVALYEAVHGERPFRGETLPELSAAVTKGRLAPLPSSGRKVPAWIRRILVRGLSTDPADRHPSMDALLSALAADPAVVRRRWLTAFGVVAVGGVVVYALVGREAPVAPPVCQGAPEKLMEVWNDQARAEIRAAMLSTALPYAPDAWTSVERTVDDWGQRWVGARTEACEATRVHQEQSAEVMDRRMVCYDRHLADLRALLEVLGDADETVVKRASRAVQGLRPIDDCTSAEIVSAAIPPPEPEAADRVLALQDRLTRAKALRLAGKLDDAATFGEGLAADAEALGYAPLTVAVWEERADLDFDRGHYEPSVKLYRRVHAAAIEHHLQRNAASSASSLMFALGENLAQPEEAQWWSHQAAAWAKAVDDPEMIAKHEIHRGMLAFTQGRYEEAYQIQQKSLALVIDTFGEDSPFVPDVLLPLANCAYELGRPDDANELYGRAVALKEHHYGPDHPDIGNSLLGWGAALSKAGRLAEARAKYERALAIYERAFGPENDDVANVLNNLANLSTEREEAMRLHRRVLAMREKLLGPDHFWLAPSLFNLGEMLRTDERFEDARPLFERALSVAVAGLGEEHPNVARIRTRLSKTLRGLGEREAADRELALAIETYEATVGGEHPLMADAIGLRAEAHVEAGRMREAIADRERAHAILEAADHPSSELASAKLALARALWDASPAEGRDRERARTMAAQARATLAGREGEDEMIEAIDAWLAEHELATEG
jgi:tetratricopeptide (TPR) repeat protein/predicted Ser/Thr protein kinase